MRKRRYALQLTVLCCVILLIVVNCSTKDGHVSDRALIRRLLNERYQIYDPIKFDKTIRAKYGSISFVRYSSSGDSMEVFLCIVEYLQPKHRASLIWAWDATPGPELDNYLSYLKTDSLPGVYSKSTDFDDEQWWLDQAKLRDGSKMVVVE